MPDARTIVVTGGTGRQGGGVARNLLGRGFRVKVLTRDPSSPGARSLLPLGAQVIRGDLDQPSSFRGELERIDGLYSVQPLDGGIETEIRRGKALADLAREQAVPFVVYSSVAGADLHSGVPHWESKFAIEQHIREIGVPFTFIRPVSFYENYLFPQMKSRILKGKLVSPISKEKVQQFVSAEDVGRVAAEAFANPEKYVGKTITLAAEQMDLLQVARIFSEVLAMKVENVRPPALVTRFVMGKDLAAMFHWVNSHGGNFVNDLDSFRREYPHLVGFRQWVERHFGMN